MENDNLDNEDLSNDMENRNGVNMKGATNDYINTVEENSGMISKEYLAEISNSAYTNIPYPLD